MDCVVRDLCRRLHLSRCYDHGEILPRFFRHFGRISGEFSHGTLERDLSQFKVLPKL